MNIISDVAGEYNTLIALIKKMPQDKLLAVGDLIDRGPDSDKVIRFFMEESAKGNAQVLLGNHEHMMLDWCNDTGYYDRGNWQRNGGDKTLNNFNHNIPDDVFQWASHLDLFYRAHDVFISHAFLNPSYPMSEMLHVNRQWYDQGFENNIIWNRYGPAVKSPYKFQIAGHNSQMGLKWFANKDNKQYAVCIDSSRSQILTGLHWDESTLKFDVYQQPYI